MFLVHSIIDIHKAANNLSEFSTFGVSHFTKMSFLVAQNKAMGLEDKKCLLMSALEVYVRSSNVDLLGFGLGYYRNKLKEAITEEIGKVQPRKSLLTFDNLVLKSNELTTIKLVKMQAEPLLTMLHSR
jgi:midasin